MEVYCVIGVEYIQGMVTTSIPKIYGVFIKESEALKAKRKLFFSGIDNLSINKSILNESQ